MELYHIRHAHRNGKNPHISKDGLLFAQEISEKLPLFDVVLSSISLRAIETTIALGFPITDTVNFDDVTPKTQPTDPNQVFNTFKEYQENIGSVTYYKEFSDNLVQLLNKKLSQYKNAKKILLVSHGGVIECSTIGFLPALDYAKWGATVSHCNGVKLVFKEGKCVSGEKFS